MADRYTELVEEVIADLEDARREYNSSIQAGRPTNTAALQYFFRLSMAHENSCNNVPYRAWKDVN